MKISGLSEFGTRMLIYEVEDNTHFTTTEVERMNVYDFLNRLSYIRSKSKYVKIINE
jgi:hypothetical protein